MKKKDISATLSKASALHSAGNLNDAEALYQLVLVADPAQPDALGLLGTVYLQRGNRQEGVRLIEASLKASPKQPAILKNYCMALMGLKRIDEAVIQYGKLVAMDPKNPEAHYGLGNALRESGRYDEALISYGRASSLKPDYAAAIISQGNVLQLLKRYSDAMVCYDKAITLKPDYSEAYNNRGIAFVAMKRHEQALGDFEKTISLKPASFEAHVNLSDALRVLGRFDEALVVSEKAIALRPDHADAYNNRGSVLKELRRDSDALAAFDQAIACNPEHAEAYYNRSNILRELRRFDEALAGYEKVMALKPDTAYLLGNILYTSMNICKWRDMDAVTHDIARGIEAGKAVCTPFSLLATPLSGAQKKKCAEIFIRDKFPEHPHKQWNGDIYAHDKIRLGYFSADFHNHATAHLMAELFERHDRSRFEVTAFSFGPAVNDSMRQRLEKGFDHFIDIRTKSDSEVAALARNMEIDIALDLKGFSQHLRTGIFARRPAPIQVNYLVYPGTMGAHYIDYMIADATLIPAEHQADYSEKIVYMPHSYQVNDSQRKISDKQYTRKELGLPEKGFVFCCFNNSYKLTPDIFDIWMRLLHKVEGSVLWLLESSAFARKNIISEASARGVAEERLVFAERLDLPEHLARHRLADLFLDTFYVNAHTTASDALWAELPVLTCIGGTFAARVAASLLHALGLPELVTDSHASYEALAVELATNPQKLSAIKMKLSKNRLAESLFNTPLYTRHLEAAYVEMWKRYQAGRVPEHIHIQA